MSSFQQFPHNPPPPRKRKKIYGFPLSLYNLFSGQDDHGDLSAVNMDTAVAIRTLEATYKSSADAVALETMIVKLTEKVCFYRRSDICYY